MLRTHYVNDEVVHSEIVEGGQCIVSANGRQARLTSDQLVGGGAA